MNKQAAGSKGSNLTRSGSVKDLIHRFSVADDPMTPSSDSPEAPSARPSAIDTGMPKGPGEPSQPPAAPESRGREAEISPRWSAVPSVTVTETLPPEGSPQTDTQSKTTGPLNGAPANSGAKVVSVTPSDATPPTLTACPPTPRSRMPNLHHALSNCHSSSHHPNSLPPAPLPTVV